MLKSNRLAIVIPRSVTIHSNAKMQQYGLTVVERHDDRIFIFEYTILLVSPHIISK